MTMKLIQCLCVMYMYLLTIRHTLNCIKEIVSAFLYYEQCELKQRFCIIIIIIIYFWLSFNFGHATNLHTFIITPNQ